MSRCGKFMNEVEPRHFRSTRYRSGIIRYIKNYKKEKGDDFMDSLNAYEEDMKIFEEIIESFKSEGKNAEILDKYEYDDEYPYSGSYIQAELDNFCVYININRFYWKPIDNIEIEFLEGYAEIEEEGLTYEEECEKINEIRQGWKDDNVKELKKIFPKTTKKYNFVYKINDL